MSIDLSAETILDVLGNENRRKIIKLLAEEPKYLLQLSKEIREVSITSIQKHLEVLETSGLITSFEGKSELGGPPRRYYKLKTALCLTVNISAGFMDIRLKPIASQILPALNVSLAGILKLIEELSQLNAADNTAKASGDILNQIDKVREEVDSLETSLLYFRQKVLEAVSKVARESFGSSLEKKVLYTILSERTPADPALISVKLDVREKTVEEAIAELKKKRLLDSQDQP